MKRKEAEKTQKRRKTCKWPLLHGFRGKDLANEITLIPTGKKQKAEGKICGSSTTTSLIWVWNPSSMDLKQARHQTALAYTSRKEHYTEREGRENGGLEKETTELMESEFRAAHQGQMHIRGHRRTIDQGLYQQSKGTDKILRLAALDAAASRLSPRHHVSSTPSAPFRISQTQQETEMFTTSHSGYYPPHLSSSHAVHEIHSSRHKAR